MKKLFILSITAIFLISCGGGQSESQTKAAPASQPEAVSEPAEESAPAEPEVAKLVINGSDQMNFDKDELKVLSGSKVELTLNHTGELAKAAMGHNVVILKKGTDVVAFATKAIAAKDNDYIPEGDEILVHTEMVGGGESTTISFDAPERGSYDFICSFPGHYALMKGKFIVL
ncbi:MAG: azurin [Bacteroidota bacterium]